MHFRKDINGLRAIAVLAVVLFHFNENWMPGGFAGVDVFFVISGFLMTGIIFRGIDKKRFSIINFYIDRANRIIPALALVCFVLLCFGWFYLTPLDYKALGKHALGSIGFISNIIYLKESGYFDAASHEKWLLHTWSLSVEWQFYIIYPLVLVILRKLISEKTTKTVLLLGTILGFMFCVFSTYKWPDAAYYLLPTRAWEMMMGGIAYLYPFTLNEKKKKVIEWSGLALIASSYAFIDKENSWPGYLALLPVLGSFLIIQASRNDSFITGNIAFQKIGSWSYSIYLWHWPLVVSIAYFSLNDSYLFVGLALSILLGYLSSKYVETIKFNINKTRLTSYLNYKPAHIALVVFATASATFINNGFISRFDEIDNITDLESNRESSEIYYRTKLMNAFSNDGEPYENSFLCTLDGGRQSTSSAIECLTKKLGKSGYLIIGDSHGRDALHALKLSYPNTNFSMLHQSSCVPTTYTSGKTCFSILNDIRDKFITNNKHIKGVIFASLYGDDLGINSFLNDIQNKVYGNLPVFIINAGPRLEKTVVELAIEKTKVTNQYVLGTKNNKAIEINSKLSKIKNVKILDKYSVFCKNTLCILNSGLQPYLWDSGHLSLIGIEKLSDYISKTHFLEADKISSR